MANVQSIVSIEDIQDGIIILKGGALRAILLASAVNFSLKSQEEQDALTSGYQNFLNSLDFQLQIIIASRKLDISDYLRLLENKRREQPNELLRIQIAEYTDFIKTLTEMSNIMNQIFYVVVPFSPIEKKGGVFESLNIFKKSEENEEVSLEESKLQIMQRVEFIKASLNQLGIKSVQLNRDELAELMYHFYNPEAVERIPPENKTNK